MSRPIRKVAVLGAGVMGTGIAAHLANAGIPSLLFDIVPADAGDAPAARNAFALKGIQGALKSRPAALHTPACAELITPCNYDDHADQLASCDWIVEVVVERLDIKKKVYQWVADNRAEGSVVSSNTSGIKLADMAAGMPEEMRSNFLITHFFNPVRYMRLLEIVSGPETDPAVVERMATFGERHLGKGIVYAKDTPNFIANRVGTFGMASVFKHMARHGLNVEQVDAIFGPALGRPKSAVFRTADLVGLDTFAHVISNLYDGVPDDECREYFVLPDYVKQMIANGQLGSKSGSGFYKKGVVDGKKAILALDTETLTYREQEKVRYDSLGAARKKDKLADKLQAVVYADDVAGKCAWDVTADTLIYAANRIPEIADDVVNIDNGMKWGFGWDVGPFETWDAIGVRRSVEKMEAEGRTVPAWVKDMLASGQETFYARGDDGLVRYAVKAGGTALVPTSDAELDLVTLRAQGREIERNASASLFDLGDGVLGLEFHSKMNALDNLIFEQYAKALDMLDADRFDALVVGNQDSRAFCAGANVLMILMGAMQGDWKGIESQIDQLQQLMMRAKYHRKPVVTAPHQLTLGGGAETTMHSAATVASGELYMGLVEVGVGLIPGAGGCKEMVMRYAGEFPQDIEYDPNPFVQKAFERIGLAKVATSAGEARDLGFLRATDTITMNPAHLLHDAKKRARGLADGGYVAPRKRTVKLPGPSGKAAIELFLYQMHEGGFATEHDVTVGKALAKVLTGGDIPPGTVRTEQDLLDLEREVFMGLCGEPKSQARMQHMLQTGKPLRN
ncbi:MAG: 3-hydroxyacyl-CoA dehydrogenase/enoyl-CoA hydratase family protein [Alphaproteobacteria bacterium]|nr:3-hydroxyacyl-CoA dehydrogenase/enoyl-CoA hydratase family protein [Alphaproteobacteria bacterium]MCB9690458.1 3-hydroxyacyl-CoA dehydrogenase/enoyl-CoA hydratase family protein [Alphaproteobacteria bacterium]